MRSFRGVALALGVGVGVLIASANADAKNVYRWETDEGVVSFTDELKRVPERYREQVVRIDTRTLSSAKRFSKMAEPATAQHASQVSARLEGLRHLNEAADGSRGPGAEGVPAVTLDEFSLTGTRRDGSRMRSVDQVMPTLNLGAVDNEAPVVVEEIRVRSDDSPPVTRRVTVIRQGEKILAVIKPTARRAYGLDFPSESELEVEH